VDPTQGDEDPKEITRPDLGLYPCPACLKKKNGCPVCSGKRFIDRETMKIWKRKKRNK